MSDAESKIIDDNYWPNMWRELSKDNPWGISVFINEVYKSDLKELRPEDSILSIVYGFLY